MLEGEPRFQKWVANVYADSDKQPFLVYWDRDGNLGNYQRAEVKWLREHGFGLVAGNEEKPFSSDPDAGPLDL